MGEQLSEANREMVSRVLQETGGKWFHIGEHGLLDKIIQAARTEGPHPGESGEWEDVARRISGRIKAAKEDENTRVSLCLGDAEAAVSALRAASPPPKGAGADPVAWQRRMRNTRAPQGHPHAEWSAWRECTDEQVAYHNSSGGKVFGYPELETAVRPVFAALPVEGVTEGQPLADDVVRLVIAAREVAFGDAVIALERDGRALIAELDAASEAFASRVPWEDEPAALTARKPGGV